MKEFYILPPFNNGVLNIHKIKYYKINTYLLFLYFKERIQKKTNAKDFREVFSQKRARAQ
ncbi:hypothetical protein LEP1GSC062_2096 [Leptospira alexanderi serovar Manhao 3 str. L 60]|uniref:Uncharacterized protein n=1 Tax=Leptospira alexanderi serovar Manhao 3 str. L 60 TaxID=1049759 RepID=V6ICV3_9LEPT|nr:hypothetical protein LEP1GSC062_2096 [Leptospira alexanderi serovar Manhao 3 str. L 60]